MTARARPQQTVDRRKCHVVYSRAMRCHRSLAGCSQRLPSPRTVIHHARFASSSASAPALRRQHRAYRRTKARATAWPAIHRREQARCRQQYRDRVRLAGAERRLYAAAGNSSEYDQYDAGTAEPLRLRTRFRAGDAAGRAVEHPGRASRHRREKRRRSDRARKIQARVPVLRLLRGRNIAASFRRVVQPDGGRETRACALSRQRTGCDRPPCQPCAGDVLTRPDRAAARRKRLAARTRVHVS